jgi:hypothetical protein
MDREPPDPPTNERLDAADTGPPEVRIPAGEGQHQLSRRGFLGMLGLGAGTVAVVGAGGLTWRAVDRGVFATGTGSAYAAWEQWNPPGGDVLDLVRAAVLAANAHNTQPWRFRVWPTRIDLFADTARNIGAIDPLRRELGLSLGCALENLVLAGPPNGKTPTVTLLPDPADTTHVARVDLTSTPAAVSPLFATIPDRHTNRAAYHRGRPVPRGTLDGLQGLIDTADTEVVWFTTAEQTRAFGDLTVRATEAIIADPQQAADDYAWYRAAWSELQAKKDGITIDAAGLAPLIRTLGKLLPASRGQNDDAWLRATRDTQVPTAAAFGTLVVRDPLDPAQRLQTGRIWQRMHLWATTKGLAMQPLNQVEERVDRERTAGLSPEFSHAMAGMLPAGWHAVFSFRIGYPTADAPPSPRRPVEHVVRR